MNVSIIIINYKSGALVMDCIQSIVQQTAAGSYEIIVVDNDSQDGAKEKILNAYPEVRWLALDYNAGFARANNAGMKIAKGDYYLILNADTVILEKAIDKSIALLKNYPGAVGCGIQLLNGCINHYNQLQIVCIDNGLHKKYCAANQARQL